jgi:hypothetical protein
LDAREGTELATDPIAKPPAALRKSRRRIFIAFTS